MAETEFKVFTRIFFQKDCFPEEFTRTILVKIYLNSNGDYLLHDMETMTLHEVKSEDNRVFVIISDALRYEVAASLAEQLRRETQSKVTLGSCAGIFPTVTKFWMAALPPHKQLSINECSNGDLQILADGMSTDASNQDKALKATNISSVALKYKDIAPMKRAERSALVKGMDVV